MASHQLAIAKASLAAALLRPDPVSVNREDVAQFHGLLDEAVARCSPSNVQTCKTWLLDNILSSAGRIAALAKYMLALSTSFSSDRAVNIPSDSPSAKRKRLHLLYLLNDLLHHTKYHGSASSRHASLASNLQPQLVGLFTSAASFDGTKHPKHHKKISDLVDLWESHSFLSRIFLDSLRDAIKTAGAATAGSSDPTLGPPGTDDASTATGGATRQTAAARDAPYMMPATHGDSATPYYDLPAGNLIPHIVPNSTMSINPELVKPLHFVPGPADKSLVNVVRDFLIDVDAIFTASNTVGLGESIPDLDEMGQPIVEHGDDEPARVKESYYGWSIAFCDKMKKRKRGRGLSDTNHGPRGRQHSRSNSRSHSGSSTPRKRRRYSSSASPSRENGRGSRPSTSRSRSRSRSRRGRDRDRHAHSPGSERSSPRRRPSSAQRSKKRSHSPDGEMERRQPPPLWSSDQAFVTPIDQIDNPFATFMPPAPAVPNASSFQHNFPIGPNGLPMPPPPPFHQGPWPPPPPPSLPSGVQFNPEQIHHMSTAVFPRGSFVSPAPPGAQGTQQSPGLGARQNVHSPPVPPPPPPPAALGPGWEEQSGHQLRDGQQWNRNDPRGRGQTSGNWFSGQDPRKR